MVADIIRESALEENYLLRHSRHTLNSLSEGIDESVAVTPRRIEVFLAVAAEEYMMRAARLLGTPQPSLSRQIAALETEIDGNLFVRTGRGVVLDLMLWTAPAQP